MNIEAPNEPTNIISFGKHKGKNYYEMYEQKYWYCKWVLKQENLTTELQRFKQWIFKQNTAPVNINEFSKTIYNTSSKNSYKVISYNMDATNTNIKNQAKMIQGINADIVMLQEAVPNISNYLKDYYCLTITKSHCLFTTLLINKKHNIQIKQLDAFSGGVLSVVDINGKPFVIVSVHLAPHKKFANKRRSQLKEILMWIYGNKLTNHSIIIGGDTNMRHNEGVEPSDNFLTDVYYSEEHSYGTWPNPPDKPFKFRFDRFWCRNIIYSDYNVIDTKRSDHYMISFNVHAH